jgi:Protein of unknown function (DUF3455)
MAQTDETYLHSLPAIIVNKPVPPKYLAYEDHHYDPLGDHYFDAAGTPTFNLTAIGLWGFVAKQDGVPAPANSSIGPDKTSAVPWLYLNDKPGYVQKNISQVYRVETAGGNPKPNCTETGVMQIQYAAEYWFF